MRCSDSHAMRHTTATMEVVEIFVGTLGVGLVLFSLARGIHTPEKLLFVPFGLLLAGIIFWRQRKRNGCVSWPNRAMGKQLGKTDR